MKRLLVLRHGKSDWSAGVDDAQRPLNPRGRRQAAALGRLLVTMDEVPQLAITSSATRARTTLELAATKGSWDTRVVVTDELYGTTPGGALLVASEAPDDVDRLLLVGHQPTWGDLVQHLTGGAVELKTATVVGIDLPIASWETVGAARGSIAFVVQPDDSEHENGS